MITNKDIIVFSDDWGRHPSSCQHLIRQLLNANRVIWVNTIGMRSPKISLYDIKRCFQILFNWIIPTDEQKGEVHPNLMVVRPIIIPYNNFSFARMFNKFSVRKTIRSIMKKKGVTAPIVITTFPCTCDYIGLFDAILDVYYCVDDFVNWPGVDVSLIRHMEDDLIQNSDLVLATADSLCISKERFGVKPILLEHGVDFEHFNSSLDKFERPLELQNITLPIIGFFGAISSWLDFNLIASLANECPQWSFVLIGPVDTAVSAFSGIKNIFLLGKISYNQLPRYAACFDVGIIPFQINDLTNSVNPLKLLEYLSLGIPVVSSYMPEVTKYSDYVSICRNKKEFMESIEVALGQNTMTLRKQRIEFAQNHSWRSVAERFSNLVKETEFQKLNKNNFKKNLQ